MSDPPASAAVINDGLRGEGSSCASQGPTAEPWRKAALPWGPEPPSWPHLAFTPASVSGRARAASPHLRGLCSPVCLRPAGRHRASQVKGCRVRPPGRPSAEMGLSVPRLIARAGSAKPPLPPTVWPSGSLPRRLGRGFSTSAPPGRVTAGEGDSSALYECRNLLCFCTPVLNDQKK